MGDGPCGHQQRDELSYPRQFNVPACRMDASDRQHAVSLDLRRQPRRRNGTCQISRLLPCLRYRCRAGPCAGCALFQRADGRRLRCDCRGDGWLLVTFSARPR